MLANGVNIGNAKLESPKSIGTAVSILGILISAVSNEQYGGVSVHEVDKLLKPYAELTHEKNIELYKGAGSPVDEIERLAKEKTIKDIYDAMQSI